MWIALSAALQLSAVILAPGTVSSVWFSHSIPPTPKVVSIAVDPSVPHMTAEKPTGEWSPIYRGKSQLGATPLIRQAAICQTPYFWCVIFGPPSYGYPCYCNTPNGPVPGVTNG
jgi:hypothetical protein